MDTPNRRIVDLRGLSVDECIDMLIDLADVELKAMRDLLHKRKTRPAMLHMMALANAMEAIGDMIGIE